MPAGAGGGEARLFQSACRQNKAARHWTRDSILPSRVVERVHLQLIEGLSEEREIERRVRQAPAQGKLCRVLMQRQDVECRVRPSHRVLHQAVPVLAHARLQNQAPRDRPGVLRVATGLTVCDADVRTSCEGAAPRERAVAALHVDFAARGRLRKR